MTDHDDHQLKDWGDLVLALGGSPDPPSFTARVLDLAQHADPQNLARLRLAYPRIVRGWEWWRELAPDITANELQTVLDHDWLARDLAEGLTMASDWASRVFVPSTEKIRPYPSGEQDPELVDPARADGPGWPG